MPLAVNGGATTEPDIGGSTQPSSEGRPGSGGRPLRAALLTQHCRAADPPAAQRFRVASDTVPGPAMTMCVPFQDALNRRRFVSAGALRLVRGVLSFQESTASLSGWL